MSTSPVILTLTSPAFEHNRNIPIQYTCEGDELSPPLHITNVDPAAKSFALIFIDPDARIGIFDHWLKWNIPPETTIIEEGKEPQGVAGKGSSGMLTYKGPCPTIGTHRYTFRLYALDTMLDLEEGSTREQLEKAMEGHVLQFSELIGLYAKKGV